MKRFVDCGVCVPDILLPAQKKLDSWSVVACDQYTQDKDYWDNVLSCVKNEPSTLNLILPELYLSSPDCDERIKKIRTAMNDYLSGGVFDDEKEELIYLERVTGYGRKRSGLVCAIDLDCYEWQSGNTALIRATEQTIVERIPPRKKIRSGAPLESPHIMLLVNDPDRLLVESLGAKAKQNSPVYDGDLMLNAGHITGWSVCDKDGIDAFYSALLKLKEQNVQKDGSSFLFAVGDGNHSLATAKAVWEEHKKTLVASGAGKEELETSPVRYALVEIVNIYDEGLTFEPIHRVLFGSEPQKLIEFLKTKFDATTLTVQVKDELETAVKNSSADFGFVYTACGHQNYVLLKTKIQQLAVSVLQPALDEFVKQNGLTIDYIHGSDEVFRLGAKEQAVSVLLPPVDKSSFFKTIADKGSLPRKSFSMGEASEKRFYLECKKLF